MVDGSRLIDLGFICHPFTWNNKRIGKTNIQERLDQSFVNSDWRLLYPSATITHLTALHS